LRLVLGSSTSTSGKKTNTTSQVFFQKPFDGHALLGIVNKPSGE
jgi:hypothetical protein